MEPKDRNPQLKGWRNHSFLASKVKNLGYGREDCGGLLSSHDHAFLILYLCGSNSHLLESLRSLVRPLFVRALIKSSPRGRQRANDRLGAVRWLGLGWRYLFRTLLLTRRFVLQVRGSLSRLGGSCFLRWRRTLSARSLSRGRSRTRIREGVPCGITKRLEATRQRALSWRICRLWRR